MWVYSRKSLRKDMYVRKWGEGIKMKDRHYRTEQSGGIQMIRDWWPCPSATPRCMTLFWSSGRNVWLVPLRESSDETSLSIIKGWEKTLLTNIARATTRTRETTKAHIDVQVVKGSNDFQRVWFNHQLAAAFILLTISEFQTNSWNYQLSYFCLEICNLNRNF